MAIQYLRRREECQVLLNVWLHAIHTIVDILELSLTHLLQYNTYIMITYYKKIRVDFFYVNAYYVNVNS